MAWYDKDVMEGWTETRVLVAERRGAAWTAFALTLATTALAGLWLVLLPSGVFRAVFACLVVLGVSASLVRLGMLVSSGRSSPPWWFGLFWAMNTVRLFRRR